MFRFALIPALACATSISFAEIPASKAFLKLTSLVGTWEGKAGMGPTGTTTKVTYRLTGAGSTLIETQFPGTPHEMVTMYYLDGNRLLLTHYCAAQNQPTMKLLPTSTEKALAFDFVSGTNMKPSDMHMHKLRIDFLDADHITSEWTSFSSGKPGMVAHFDLHRLVSK